MIVITAILAAMALLFSLFYFNYVEERAGVEGSSRLHDILVPGLVLPGAGGLFACFRRRMKGSPPLDLVLTIAIIVIVVAALFVIIAILTKNAPPAASSIATNVHDWAQSLFPGMG